MCRFLWRHVLECFAFVYISVTIFVWYEDDCGAVYLYDSYFLNNACDYISPINIPFRGVFILCDTCFCKGLSTYSTWDVHASF